MKNKCDFSDFYDVRKRSFRMSLNLRRSCSQALSRWPTFSTISSYFATAIRSMRVTSASTAERSAPYSLSARSTNVNVSSCSFTLAYTCARRGATTASSSRSIMSRLSLLLLLLLAVTKAAANLARTASSLVADELLISNANTLRTFCSASHLATRRANSRYE